VRPAHPLAAKGQHDAGVLVFVAGRRHRRAGRGGPIIVLQRDEGDYTRVNMSTTNSSRSADARCRMGTERQRKQIKLFDESVEPRAALTTETARSWRKPRRSWALGIAKSPPRSVAFGKRGIVGGGMPGAGLSRQWELWNRTGKWKQTARR
jgi:hypothetical protein